MTVKVVIGKQDVSEFVKSVDWSGHTGKFNRQISVSLINTIDGRKRAFKVSEGDMISFGWEGKTLFIGIIFAFDADEEGNMSITAYDPNIYLVKSNDIRKFTNMKASDIVKKLAKDFGIPTGTITNTGYVIPRLIFRDKSLFDMILTALTLTRKQTGKRFFIGNDNGKLTLKSPADSKNRFVLQAGSNLTGASYSRSIEDTKTQIKVTGGNKKKPITSVVNNTSLRNKFGVLQHVEEMDEKATASQVKQRAATLLKEMAVINDQANVESIGIVEVISGTAIYVAEPLSSIAGSYFISSDSHTFTNGMHTMSLELSKSNDLPPIKIDKEVLGK